MIGAARKARSRLAMIVAPIDFDVEPRGHVFVTGQHEPILMDRGIERQFRPEILRDRSLGPPDQRVAPDAGGGEEAAGRPSRARRQVILLLDVATVGRGADPRRQRCAGIVALEQDVGDTTDRVGSVDRRRAVGDDLDPIECRQRALVDVDALDAAGSLSVSAKANRYPEAGERPKAVMV